MRDKFLNAFIYHAVYEMLWGCCGENIQGTGPDGVVLMGSTLPHYEKDMHPTMQQTPVTPPPISRHFPQHRQQRSRRVAAEWRGQWVQVSGTTVTCTRGTIHDAQFLAHNKLAYAVEARSLFISGKPGGTNSKRQQVPRTLLIAATMENWWDTVRHEFWR
ncbi:hypothetical protein BDR04DRAFT_1121467 [Suillus decipiens]|nr:hypothetical protein BDR04DRAFT_1121467 [Suillus decipiens]